MAGGRRHGVSHTLSPNVSSANTMFNRYSVELSVFNCTEDEVLFTGISVVDSCVL